MQQSARCPDYQMLTQTSAHVLLPSARQCMFLKDWILYDIASSKSRTSHLITGRTDTDDECKSGCAIRSDAISCCLKAGRLRGL
jgi:hypothetical protein